MQKRITSRLARRQGKRMVRQSWLMIILAIAGGWLFLFVIMPQLVQLFFRIFGNGDLNFKQEDNVPPQIPIVTPLPEATKEDRIEITGYGEPESKVVIVDNGDEVTRTDVDQDGNFTYTLTLEDGDNEINVYGIDQADNESNTRTYLVVKDNQPPTLAFEDLEDGKQITLRQNQTLTIRGETEPSSQLTLNDRNVYVGGDGTFSTNFYLNEGDNTLKFIAIDQAGNRTEREVRVNFRY